MVQHHFHNDSDSTLVGGRQEALEIVQRSVDWVNGSVVGDVVTVVAQGRREEGHQPYRVDSQIPQVVELLGQSLEVANAISVAVVKRTDVDLIDDSVLVPKRVLFECQRPLSYPW